MSASRTARRRERILPPERLSPRRQLELLDTVADLGGEQRVPVPPAAVADRMRLSVKTISSAPGFFEQAGLAEHGRGAWRVSETGLRLAWLRAADSARARILLHRHWQGQWFQQDAVRLLAAGALEEGVFADRLGRDLPGPSERRLCLVEWLAYALIVERDEDGLITLPQDTPGQAGRHAGPAQAAGTHGIIDPLLHKTAKDVTTLPTARFLELMAAFRSVFTALAPSAPSGPAAT
ncbi:hypothetical protein [Streptomyces roseoverticillatus]|uniref:Uncharacterized protein n=1 Tax=Streptomyces roseoverticillatus TaxID=66429 RepID=A0ABV3IXA4_9ACTN